MAVNQFGGRGEDGGGDRGEERIGAGRGTDLPCNRQERVEDHDLHV